MGKSELVTYFLNACCFIIHPITIMPPRSLKLCKSETFSGKKTLTLVVHHTFSCSKSNWQHKHKYRTPYTVISFSVLSTQSSLSRNPNWLELFRDQDPILKNKTGLFSSPFLSSTPRIISQGQKISCAVPCPLLHPFSFHFCSQPSNLQSTNKLYASE